MIFVFMQFINTQFRNYKITFRVELGGYVKLKHLNDCPDHILQIALMANKYPTLFYLKGARW